MLNRTSDLTVNSHMHPRHGLLGISVLRLAAAFLKLMGHQKSATCKYHKRRLRWATITTKTRR